MTPSTSHKPLKTTGPAQKKASQSIKVTPKQMRLVLLGVVALVVIVFLVVAIRGSSMLADKSQKLVDAKLKDKTTSAQLTSLEQAKKLVQQYSYFNDIAKTVLPTDKDQAQAVLDIFHLASKSGITIASITFPASNLGASGAASATGSTTTAISQAKPVTGINGLYSLELTITPQSGPSVSNSKVVTYTKFLNFLSRLENDRRTAQVSQVTVQPADNATGPRDAVNFSLVINIFMRPSK